MRDLLTGTVAGILLTSLVAPYMLDSKNRRKDRVQVLRSLFELEVSRNAIYVSSRLTYIKDEATFRAAALVANMDYDLIYTYIYLCRVSRKTTEMVNDLQAKSKKPLTFPGVTSEFMDLISYCIDEMHLMVAHPYWYHIRQVRSTQKINYYIEQVKMNENKKLNIGQGSLMYWGPDYRHKLENIDKRMTSRI